tara:strand:- start:15244 stop:15879 length:636 start_codon:yes stop_codon:yes gene_type:complete
MTITYPLSVPNTTSFALVRMLGVSSTGQTVSPFTQTTQQYQWAGQYWEADITTIPLNRAQSAEWEAFFLKLKGTFGTFYLQPDPNSLTNQGTNASSPGSPTINGAHSANISSLSLTGATGGQTNYFKASDYISIGTGTSKQLFKVLSDANTDGGGNVTVDIFPRLRTALSGGESVTTSNCTGVFRLVSNEITWTVNHQSLYSLSFSCREAL